MLLLEKSHQNCQAGFGRCAYNNGLNTSNHLPVTIHLNIIPPSCNPVKLAAYGILKVMSTIAQNVKIFSGEESQIYFLLGIDNDIPTVRLKLQ